MIWIIIIIFICLEVEEMSSDETVDIFTPLKFAKPVKCYLLLQLLYLRKLYP
jgi:hypothetical protein